MIHSNNSPDSAMTPYEPDLRVIVSLDVEEEGLFSGNYAATGCGVRNVALLRRLAPLTNDLGFPLTLFCAHTVFTNTEACEHLAWMDRQVLFLKFCMPGQWKLLGLMCAMMALPMVCAGLALLGWVISVGSGAGVLLAIFWLAALVSALHLWRGLLSKPVPLLGWCWAFVDAVRLFTSVYWQSLKAWSIEWHGIRYEVGKGGVVLRSERS